MPFRRIPLLLATLLLAHPFLFPQSEPAAKLPSSDEVMKKAVARAKYEKDKKQEDRFAFTQLSVSEELDKNGKVKERNQYTHQVVLVEGRPYQRLVEKNGKPLTGDDLKKEAEREKKFRESIAKPPKKNDDDDDDLDLTEDVVARFQNHVIGKEEVSGRTAYKVTFLPRSDIKLPEKKRMDRFINRLEGTMWLDAETFALLKLDMHLTEPVSILGVMANIRQLDLRMLQAMVAPDVFAPQEIEMRIDGRKLFSAMRLHQTVQFKDFRPLSGPAQTAGKN